MRSNIEVMTKLVQELHELYIEIRSWTEKDFSGYIKEFYPELIGICKTHGWWRE